MRDGHAPGHDVDARPALWRTSTGVTAIGFALVAAFFALREHGAASSASRPTCCSWHAR